MNQKKIIVFIFTILAIGAIGYFILVKNQKPISPINNNLPPSTSNQPAVQNPSEEEKVLEITLEVKAPFSTAKLAIYQDGSALYSEKKDGQAEKQGIYEVDTVTSARQMNKFRELVRENNFFSMKDKPKRSSDPEDGSTYSIVVKIRPAGPPELVDAAVHTVSCYQFSCEPRFLEIQNEMRAYFKSYWSKEVLEVGV